MPPTWCRVPWVSVGPVHALVGVRGVHTQIKNCMISCLPLSSEACAGPSKPTDCVMGLASARTKPVVGQSAAASVSSSPSSYKAKGKPQTGCMNLGCACVAMTCNGLCKVELNTGSTVTHRWSTAPLLWLSSLSAHEGPWWVGQRAGFGLPRCRFRCFSLV